MMQVPEQGPTNLVGMKVEDDIKGRGRTDCAQRQESHCAPRSKLCAKRTSAKSKLNRLNLKARSQLSDIVNTETGEVVLEANNEITPAKLQEIIEEGIQTFSVFFPERDDIGPVLSLTLKKDAITKPVDALLEIYRKMRPGDPPTVPTAYRLARRRCSSIRGSLTSRASDD